MAETRRAFTREYKLSAVKLVTEQGRSFSEAARSLGIASELLRRWKAAFEADGAEASLDTARSVFVGRTRDLSEDLPHDVSGGFRPGHFRELARVKARATDRGVAWARARGGSRCSRRGAGRSVW